MRTRRLAALATAVACFLGLAWPSNAAPPRLAQAVITYPTSSSTVSGVVEIQGTAVHSSSSWWYDISYAPGPQATASSQWVSLGTPQNSPVQNGVLATWDTAPLPDGLYTLALTVRGETDPTYYQAFVTNLRVDNSQLVPTATPRAVPTEAAGPTPTPIPVVQPATSTPRPTATPLGLESGSSPSGSSGSALDPSALGNAFCWGGQIAAMLFVLVGVYSLGRACYRYYLRERSEPSAE
jgi:hypothetical protein